LPRQRDEQVGRWGEDLVLAALGKRRHARRSSTRS
jgi:hypothetical protein